MYSKSLLIAIAALALTATSAQAFSSETLVRAGLTESQLAAFEVARELRQEGDPKAARDVLLQAGIDAEVIERVRQAMALEQQSHRAAVKAAVAAGDYAAFVVAVKDTPLADIITSETDFDRFKEAFELRQAGDTVAAAEIFEELGMPKLDGNKNPIREKRAVLADLSIVEQEAFAVARAANNRDAMQAILEAAGVSGSERSHRPLFLRDGRELD